MRAFFEVEDTSPAIPARFDPTVYRTHADFPPLRIYGGTSQSMPRLITTIASLPICTN